MRTSTLVTASFVPAFVSALASAQVTVDGILDAGYGPAAALQDTATGFGDANMGVMDYANGSELDAAYGVIEGDRLQLFFAGNLESNFNKFELFIDCIPNAGQNRLLGNNPDVDFNGLNRMGDDGTGNGLTFDEGFAADWYFVGTCGNGPLATYANLAQLLTDGGGVGGYLGQGGAGAAGVLVAENGLMWTLDNSNTVGVTGNNGGAGSGGEFVTTGIEVSIPLAVLGYTAGDAVSVCAFINGGGHDYMSNQVLGGVGGLPNLSCGPDAAACGYVDPRFVNFSLINGSQSAVVVAGGGGGNPCPTDLDGDGETTGSDLAALLGGWGSPAGDLDGSGDTDGSDLAVMLGAWGPCQ